MLESDCSYVKEDIKESLMANMESDNEQIHFQSDSDFHVRSL